MRNIEGDDKIGDSPLGQKLERDRSPTPGVSAYGYNILTLEISSIIYRTSIISAQYIL